MIKMELHKICLYYNNVTALEKVNLQLLEGEIHAIVGEHGAGKSSIAHVIAGIQRKTSGYILWNGAVLENLTHQQAMKSGIHIVTQNNPLHENMSVGENLLLDHNAGFFPILSKKKIEKKAQSYINEMGFFLDTHLPLVDLKLSDKALVDILKHLYHNPKLLILDETLEKLSSENLQKVLKNIKKRTETGLTVLFISHRVDDIYNLTDRVTIIRDGKDLLTEKIDHIDKMNLIKLAYTHALHSKELQTKETFNEILRYNETILTDLPVSLFVIDNEGLLRMQNKSAGQLLDPRGIGKPFESLIRDKTTKFYKILTESLGLKKNTTYYRVSLNKKNEQKMFNITVYPILERSTLMGNIFILVDITEQETLREQITISENLASLGLLAAGIAHEINNPLDIMGYYLENLRFSGLSTEQLNTLIGIEEEIVSMAQIVNNLISFSDQNYDNSSSFNMIHLISSLVELLRYKAEEIGIDIKWEEDKNDVFVKADRNEIKQVLLNLTHNAFDAMDDGGILSIKFKLDGQMIELEMTDTGRGIPEEKLKDIFLPFYSTKLASGKNMGLGLSLSYRIVQKYHGVLKINNLKSGGCSTILRLPIV